MRQLCAQLHTALIPSPRGVWLHGGAVYSILSFITEKAFSVIGGDKEMPLFLAARPLHRTWCLE